MSANFKNETELFQNLIHGKPVAKPIKMDEAVKPEYVEPIKEHVEISKEMYIQMMGEAPAGARSQSEINESKVQLEESIEVESDNSVLLTEDTGQELVSLLMEVKEMLSEMCTAGMMGVNLAGPSGDPDGPTKKKRKKLTRRK
tara:strand:- start:1056 stop:1484 length:429 start_codon:yes stop_codon:yes gene_type:complete